MRDITLSLKLRMLGTDKVLVPGCEPASSVTSVHAISQSICSNVTVPLRDALIAIPGSYVEYGSDYDAHGAIERWFVLPAKVVECCITTPDWYGILRALPPAPPEESHEFDHCSPFTVNSCGSDFVIYEREFDNYVPEGTNISGRTQP